MVKRVSLPTPFIAQTPPSKLPFPTNQPLLDGKYWVIGGTKKMQMIRHQKVIANRPSPRFEACFHKHFFNNALRDSSLAVF
jgi:hypothetical protein